MIKTVECSADGGKEPGRLCVSVTLAAGESVGPELGRVKAALLEWHQARGKACGSLEVEIQTEESGSREILHQFMNIISGQDPLMWSLYQDLIDAEIRLVTPAGSTIKKLGFARERNESKS